MRRPRLIAAMLMAAIVLLANVAMAGEEEGTETLEMSDYVSVHIDNTEGDTLDISYEVEVEDGVNVNVYFMDSDGFADFEAFLDFKYFKEYSKTDTGDKKKHFIWANEGDFYVVIDSTADNITKTTTVKYKVTWDNAYFKGMNWLWCIAVIVIVVIITAVLAFMKRPGEDEEGKELPPVGGAEGP